MNVLSDKGTLYLLLLCFLLTVSCTVLLTHKAGVMSASEMWHYKHKGLIFYESKISTFHKYPLMLTAKHEPVGSSVPLSIYFVPSFMHYHNYLWSKKSGVSAFKVPPIYSDIWLTYQLIQNTSNQIFLIYNTNTGTYLHN